MLSLLRLYGSAALPGFGNLFFKSYPASITEAASEILPPYTELEFQPSNSVDEEKLVSSYARKERVTMQTAVSLVEQDLDLMLSSLNRDGKVYLPMLGIFQQTAEGIDFASAYPTSTVLPAIRLKKEEEIDLEEILQEFLDDDEEFDLRKFLEEDLGEEQPKQISEKDLHYHDPRYFYIPIHKTMAKIAASFLLVLVVGVVAFIPFGSSNKPSSAASIAPISVKEKVEAKKALNKQIEKKTLADAQKEKIAKAENEDREEERLNVAPLNFQDKDPNYYAVVGAFKVQKQVDKFIASHTADKNAFKIIKRGSYFLITVSSASTQQEMSERLPLIRTEYPNVWVYKP